MRLAIIGSRDCPPIEISGYVSETPDTIVSGGARGADTLAREYAVRNNIPLLEFLPKYAIYGRKAPIMRNIQIVDNCDLLLAFWDGTSRGTKFTIYYARQKGIPCKIVDISINIVV